MSSTTNALTCLTAFLAAATMNSTLALGQTAGLFQDDDVVDFTFGDNCEKLEELSYEQMQLLAMALQDKTEDQFCMATAPLECADFNWTIEEFGTLQPSRHGSYCRFLPEVLQRGDLPLRLNGYGLNQTLEVFHVHA